MLKVVFQIDHVRGVALSLGCWFVDDMVVPSFSPPRHTAAIPSLLFSSLSTLVFEVKDNDLLLLLLTVSLASNGPQVGILRRAQRSPSPFQAVSGVLEDMCSITIDGSANLILQQRRREEA
ncbi:uncharacterized protein LOC124673149 [Lolium rigidum]|uniref:uncharacterized protein LOC124673147 n=1 Tax=Lolium rigidum TaxID=89674 RepID=UPI001F5CACBE|nr:uncharacterized protein LOC124673147 [Lolium rigidum]XP_047065233.1 uncharacterized protein LOC124673149 [Lolium rigidum]